MNGLISCKGCQFWDEFNPGTHGFCRRYPPSVHGPELDVRVEWPLTHRSDWCGEWRGEDE